MEDRWDGRALEGNTLASTPRLAVVGAEVEARGVPGMGAERGILIARCAEWSEQRAQPRVERPRRCCCCCCCCCRRRRRLAAAAAARWFGRGGFSKTEGKREGREGGLGRANRIAVGKVKLVLEFYFCFKEYFGSKSRRPLFLTEVTEPPPCQHTHTKFTNNSPPSGWWRREGGSSLRLHFETGVFQT